MVNGECITYSLSICFIKNINDFQLIIQNTEGVQSCLKTLYPLSIFEYYLRIFILNALNNMLPHQLNNLPVHKAKYALNTIENQYAICP